MNNYTNVIMKYKDEIIGKKKKKIESRWEKDFFELWNAKENVKTFIIVIVKKHKSNIYYRKLIENVVLDIGLCNIEVLYALEK